MEKLASSLQALSTGGAGSSGLGPEPTKAPAPQAALDSPTTPRPSLETLPVELQRLIMCNAPDLTSLGALVHASPELHRVYAKYRRSVLQGFVAQSLEGIHLDALGAYRSGTEEFQNTRSEPFLWAFVEEQQALYSTDPPPPPGDWTAELSLDDISCILRFHVHVVEPLTEAFAPWALGALPSKPENQAACQSASLSDTERRRIQRGFYRMQMFCNLCGTQGVERSAPARISETVDCLRVLSMFPAWEVEEILSVHEFAKDRYADIFKQVAWDLNERENPKYKHISLPSANEFLMLIHKMRDGTLYVNDTPLTIVLRYGPRLLAKTFKATSHEQLVELIRAAIESAWMVSIYGGTLDEVQDEWMQDARRAEWPNHHDSAQDHRQKTPFNGDKLGAPPLAWVLYWQGDYSNLFGGHIQEPLRRWAFVMWDAARLDSHAKDEIENAWGAGSDPREDDWNPSVANSPLFQAAA
ncbi:hypothetical protein diail_7306 [Diaporthe ilicicola]|nr:hypothetical protein diail_7306 [Diaporthe ilicicola]